MAQCVVCSEDIDATAAKSFPCCEALYCDACHEETADGGTCGVFGEKSVLSIPQGDGVAPVATFGDGTPAVAKVERGKGAVWVAAFHPGLSYFHPALPPTEPACKGEPQPAFRSV